MGAIHPGNVVSDLLSAEEIARREEVRVPPGARQTPTTRNRVYLTPRAPQAEGFITAEDVARCVMTMADLPLSANVLELSVIPSRQPLGGRG